jgi:hypothetical protein
VRETRFSAEFYAIALSLAPDGGGPFTNAIDGEHSSLVEWRGKKRAGGVTLMMFKKAESSVGGFREESGESENQHVQLSITRKRNTTFSGVTIVLQRQSPGAVTKALQRHLHAIEHGEVKIAERFPG